ncbi:acetyl-CoA carboxylase biotin carboxyl carrier protein [Weissella viridescens]|uniref:acetyl-CoA carboxylase biotin carboxyl carrier protein n=1 Tax=Weissella viridescens TaxID=1629 RepID=UPI00092EC063|nr:acetyl-CoA carboxylase biotin carboxyl carrier protein [Weissella viridescens]MBX4172638.1 acetyl-CoA carboxylase biotin carboxyl carrier protein [Weissella viridescens]
MELTLDELKDLIQTLDASSLREFSVNEGEYTLHLSKNEAPTVVTQTQTPAGPAPVAAPESAPVTDAPVVEPAGTYITAPLVGTVYLRPNPDAEPFVQVGGHVNAGDQVALIEAMKLMTPIKSDVSGTIKQVLVADEDMVDYEMNLFEIIPD